MNLNQFQLIGIATTLRDHPEYNPTGEQLKILNCITHNAQSDNNIFNGEWSGETKLKVINLIQEFIPTDTKSNVKNSHEVDTESKLNKLNLYLMETLTPYNVKCSELETIKKKIQKYTDVIRQSLMVQVWDGCGTVREQNETIKKLLEDTNIIENDNRKIILNGRSMCLLFKINTIYKSIEELTETFKNNFNMILTDIKKNIYQIEINNIKCKDSTHSNDVIEINYLHNTIMYKPIFIVLNYTILQKITKSEHRLIMSCIEQILYKYTIETALPIKIDKEQKSQKTRNKQAMLKEKQRHKEKKTRGTNDKSYTCTARKKNTPGKKYTPEITEPLVTETEYELNNPEYLSKIVRDKNGYVPSEIQNKVAEKYMAERNCNAALTTRKCTTY